MILSAILAALGLEYWRPERPGQPRHAASEWMLWLLLKMNAGGEQHGALAWTLGVLLPSLAAAAAGALLGELWHPLSWLFDVLVLYFCLGFKAASFRAADVTRALKDGDAERARGLIAEWRPCLLAGIDETSLIRQALEETLRQSMVRLFGVLFWFLLLGSAGALLYLLTRLARDRWHAEPAFGLFADKMAGWMDWLPIRIAAFSFAIAGNFQDALECWRGQAKAWGDESDGILLAAGAGALGLQLGGTIILPAGELVRPILGMEEVPGVGALDAMVALIWRAVALWVAVLGLLWLGSL